MQRKLSITGRILLCSVFVLSVVGHKLPNFQEVTRQIEGMGFSTPKVILIGIITLTALGSMSVVLGFRARVGAALLLAMMAFATYMLHPFWTYSDEQQRVEFIAFMQNLAIVGGLTFIIANGSGAGSLDLALRRQAA